MHPSEAEGFEWDISNEETLSTEEERAGFHEDHRSNAAVWEEVEESIRSPKRTGLSASITVRFSPDEAASIRRLAKESGLSYSDIVRQAVESFTASQFVLGVGGPARWIAWNTDVRPDDPISETTEMQGAMTRDDLSFELENPTSYTGLPTLS